MCGDAAKKSADLMGAAIVKRTKAADHDPSECKAEGETTSCFSPGVGEGDVAYVLEYTKAGDNWTRRCSGDRHGHQHRQARRHVQEAPRAEVQVS
jgi:hypothetical protein